MSLGDYVRAPIGEVHALIEIEIIERHSTRNLYLLHYLSPKGKGYFFNIPVYQNNFCMDEHIAYDYCVREVERMEQDNEV